MFYLKCIRFMTILLLLMAVAGVGLAAPPDYLGGVYNEYEYEEWVFISGEPIKFVGTVTVTEPERGTRTSLTNTYRFTLMPADISIQGKLDRTMSYITAFTDRPDKGQTLGQTKVSNYRETIEINGDKYVLADFFFSKSDVIDNRPASTYYLGNITGKKVYNINNNQGRVTIDMSGGNVGYENFWGKTETQVIDYVINTQRQVLVKGAEDEEDTMKDAAWGGSYRVQASDSTHKNLIYTESAPNLISFDGGHIRITNREMVSMYEYNVPRMDNGIPHATGRDRGVLQLSKKFVPKLESLIVPKFRDVGGHWSEDNIRRMYSLDVFDNVDQYFLPDVPMTRVEFTKGIIRACSIKVQPNAMAEERPTRRTRYAEPEDDLSPFKDVSSTDPDFNYVMAALERGIIKGVSNIEFGPNNPLTRAQAVTILIRALGFESKAPTPGFRTQFSDDARIPNWAKDSVYVAREIGLVHGDAANNFNPSQVMTRAEAAAMLTRFLEFLEKDLQRDYRENIILFN